MTGLPVAPQAPTVPGSQVRRAVVLATNTAWNIANFRAGLVTALQSQGFEVIALAPPDEHVARLKTMGCRFIPIPMENKGTNPLADATLLLRYLRILRREQPAAFLGYTIKPNVYGSLAAQTLGIPVINNVSGLGTAFIRETWLTKIVRCLYETAFRQSDRVFFHNDDDRQLFLAHGLVQAEQATLIPGSGIDLKAFRPRPRSLPARDGKVRFLLIARLVFDKGVREYIEAARILRRERPRAICAILGFLDVENRTAVKRSEMEGWVAEGLIEYLGVAADVRPHIAAADGVVLPSYREGTPRTLLEAAAMGKPLITTDVPGCRNAVADGVTGLLCKVGNADDLAAKMIAMADMSAAERSTMGAAGRRKMERQFDEQIVINAYLQTLRSILNRASPEASPEEEETTA